MVLWRLPAIACPWLRARVPRFVTATPSCNPAWRVSCVLVTPQAIKALANAGAVERLEDALRSSKASVQHAAGPTQTTASDDALQANLRHTLGAITQQAAASISTLVADPDNLEALAKIVEASARQESSPAEGGAQQARNQLDQTVDAIFAEEGGEVAAWSMLQRYALLLTAHLCGRNACARCVASVWYAEVPRTCRWPMP